MPRRKHSSKWRREPPDLLKNLKIPAVFSDRNSGHKPGDFFLAPAFYKSYIIADEHAQVLFFDFVRTFLRRSGEYRFFQGLSGSLNNNGLRLLPPTLLRGRLAQMVRVLA